MRNIEDFYGKGEFEEGGAEFERQKREIERDKRFLRKVCFVDSILSKKQGRRAMVGFTLFGFNIEVIDL